MQSKRLARLGLLTALAMVLSWVESLVPISTAIPGMKLGLTNLVVIFALYRLSAKEAIFLSMLRVLLVSFTFGNAYSFWYSAAGALLSFVVMALLKHTGQFAMPTVSVMGGVFHNIGQILVAMAVLSSGAVLYYLPILLLSGIGAGIAIGLAAAVLVRRIPL